jgi:hypothetical protein
MALKCRYFGKQIRNIWKVLKCGSGERWRSLGPSVRKTEKYYEESKREDYILRRNCFLKHVIEGKIEGMRRRGSRRKQLLDELM